eukprot:1148881-Pelagomonas_calceolata.AAC.17
MLNLREGMSIKPEAVKDFKLHTNNPVVGTLKGVVYKQLDFFVGNEEEAIMLPGEISHLS